MKQYIYKPTECGLSTWPPGELRLEGIEVTEDVSQTDLFVYPGALFVITSRAGLEALPYFKEHESRHVFFHCSDHDVLYDTTAMIIRCNTRTWMLDRDKNTISWPWPVEDYSECMELPEGGFKYDVSFQGWNWSDARKTATAACLNNRVLKCDFALYKDFFGYRQQSDPEYARRRSEFRRSMKESRIALCAESIAGVLPYRFLEAMSAGRVPLLVGANYVLPFADEIPYNDFILTTSNAAIADQVVLDALARHSDDRLAEMGRHARYYWAKYLDSRYWPRLMADAIQKKLA